MRYGSVMEDFTAEVVSGSIIDTEYHLICKYRKMGFEPVSYTHLDVYKRQAKARA